MKSTIINFPQIEIKVYELETCPGPMYHLYINGIFDAAYITHEDIENRLKLLVTNEIAGV